MLKWLRVCRASVCDREVVVRFFSPVANFEVVHVCVECITRSVDAPPTDSVVVLLRFFPVCVGFGCVGEMEESSILHSVLLL